MHQCPWNEWQAISANFSLLKMHADFSISALTAQYDVVFFDANHRKEAVLQYFEKCVKHISRYSVFIVDDIHWSRDMEDAWIEIQNHRDVQSTIDLFDCGLVFFDSYLSNKHYKMKH